jgi:peptidoglycan L-alanyl-D-glutamate endopeptidase CwlK
MKDSRNINDCVDELIIAFSNTKEIFENRHEDYNVICTQSYRSSQTQNALYEIGRTKPGKIVTKAKGLQSPHNYYRSLAFDVAFIKEGKADWDVKLYKEFNDILSVSNPLVEWGGNFQSFKDYPHWQRKDWKTFITKQPDND